MQSLHLLKNYEKRYFVFFKNTPYLLNEPHIYICVCVCVCLCVCVCVCVTQQKST